MDFNIDISLPISKETVSKILEPSLIPLSQSIGGIFQWVFQKPIEYGIVRPVELEILKQKTEARLGMIPSENRTSENLGLTLKAFEDSKYQLTNNFLIDYFSRLIAGTVDDRIEVKAVYSSILSEMSKEDAELFNYLFNYGFLFENQINHTNPAFNDGRYRLYSKMNYYKIVGNFQEGMHRNPAEFAPIFSENISLSNCEDSFVFLKSKGLIALDPSQSSHVLITTIEAYSLEHNAWLKEKKDSFSNFAYDKVTNQTTEVYSLTSLGRSLADLICHRE